MSKTSRREHTEAMKMRNQQKRGKRAKSGLLDEYCEVTGHERRYANKMMLGIKGPGRGRPKKAGRRSTYGPEVMKVLKRLWFLAEQACGKRLAPVLPLWMGAYEKRYGRLGKGLKEKVLKELTPVRAEAWDVEEPRWIEADIVAHGGGSTVGSFIWSLSSTDIYSGWTEIRAACNKGQHAVCGAIAV